MLDLFKRQGQRPPSGSGGSDSPQRSHIFPKFLKRLVARGRPLVLDFGRLSGENIEIFARLGCRVQVDDLIAVANEKTAAAGSDRPVTLPSVAETGSPETAAPGTPAPPAGAAPVDRATPAAAAIARPAVGAPPSG